MFERPDYIPMTFHVNDASWNHYPQEALFDLLEDHPFLFPDFIRPKQPYVPSYLPNARAGAPYTDSFGCLWKTNIDGIHGVVIEHPLSDWTKYESYQFPDPNVSNGIGTIDWAKEDVRVNAAKSKGEVVCGGLYHGHTFLRLCDLRGYEELIMDMAEENPLLDDLIERLMEFNLSIVNRYATMCCDIITYAEDLGMQNGPMISKSSFQRYIKPSYTRLMQAGKESGALIHFHSDGDIRQLADEILNIGVDVLNLQDQVNGIDWIADNISGKLCIDLDIDRQHITRNGSPKEIDTLIREVVTKLGSIAGGLTMIYGLYPGIPLSNVKALMDAMEKYAFYYN